MHICSVGDLSGTLFRVCLSFLMPPMTHCSQQEVYRLLNHCAKAAQEPQNKKVATYSEFGLEICCLETLCK